MSDIVSLCLGCVALGFCAAFVCLGVAWSMVDAVRAWHEGSPDE